jgi:1,2-diacylglycerol 3-beta-galactosyltransferase
VTPASPSLPRQPGAPQLNPRVPLLFLIADTGGGHRTAARSVTDALEAQFPGRFAPVLCDPLGGPRSSAVLRWVTGLYGPSIRLAPWTWGAIYYASDSKVAMGFLRRTLLALANRPVAEAAEAHRPGAIVSFHPLVGGAAVAASGRAARPTPVVAVVTDLITPHAAWRDDRVDILVVPSAAVRWRCHLDGISAERCHELGLPVGSAFTAGPARPAERLALRRALGLSEDRFLAVLTGGGEGSGGLAKRAAALVKAYDDVDVVAICGRNRRLEAKLRRHAKRIGSDRLVVRGFVDNMADWLRAADVVVSKAGPGTIAEATCCGAPLLITSHVPGQEKGNTEFVVGAGAGRHVPGVDELLVEVGRLRGDPAAVDAMRAGAARLGRPRAAADIAALIAATVDMPGAAGHDGLISAVDMVGPGAHRAAAARGVR